MASMDDRDFDTWLEDERRALNEPVSNAPRRENIPQERYYEPAPARSGIRWMRVLIPVAVVLMLMVAALAAGFTYANRVTRLDTIYPNVSVNGVAVGGMTLSEAAAALGDPADRYDNAVITVNFPTGDTVTVTAQDVGLKPADGMDYARTAYRYGRDGTLISNLKTYLACKSGPMDMAVCSAAPQEPDGAAIEALVAPVAQQVDKKLSITRAEVGEETITLVKNPGTAKVDVPALCQTIREAFLNEDYAAIEYQIPEPDENAAETTDVDAIFQKLYDAVYAAPVNAEYNSETREVIEGIQGVRFDIEEAKRLWSEAAAGETVTVALIREDPEIMADQVRGELFADVLSEKSTSLAGSSSARINNVTLAAAALNGTVIQPGEEFDYNTCLGQRTAAKGYQSAGAYANGQHVMNIGGGICQDSSTLYYCALYANLQITRRECHYFLVSYLPRGLDATVSWGWPDFRFVNNRDYPIKIEAYVSGGYLTVRLYGTDVDGSYVQMTSDTWEDSQYYYAQTYRHVYDRNGNLISSAAEAYSRYAKEEASTPTPAPTQAPEQTQAPAAQPQTTPEPVITPEPQPAPEAPPAPELAPDSDTAE